MGLFKSLRGKVEAGTDNSPNDHSSQYAPPSDPPPSYQQQSRTEKDDVQPPPGPPSHRPAQMGPNNNPDEFQPPPGPPPSKNENPPPYHDWTIIPDTSLLPPPPPLPQDYSPTNNASYDSAARAHEWCAHNPVYTPSTPSHEIHLLANAGHLTLQPPPDQIRSGLKMKQLSPTSWHIQTNKHQPDTIILSSIPLYFPLVDSPLSTGREKSIYFEISIHRISNANSGIAIGFAAKPYPPWRLPGWHRASIGVHGDDGRRFVNDSWGGRDFVDAFRPGEAIGVGMRFSTQAASSNNVGGGWIGKVKTRAFIRRGGRTDERWEWAIDEERDERDEGVEGLMGEGDLYPAIGVFGGVEFEVKFGDSVGWKDAR